MNASERRKRILSSLQSTEVIQIGQLATMLDASRETIRKDLYDLERDGLLTKVRGGAVLTAANAESAYDLRKTTNTEAKRSIARAAASRVKRGDIVYLDYGTTTFMVAEELLAVDGITVVTNTLPIVNRLLSNKSITVMVPGGVVRPNENSLYGPLTARNMEHLFTTIGFFGCGGIDGTAGVTNHNMHENAISAKALAHCATGVLLVDHSKFGIVAANKSAEYPDLDVVVTDEEPPADILAQLAAHDVAVEVAARP